ncbi:MAG: hypothetical protein H7255_11005 [Ramlibacter sp.]|nr:hypothetical protein [Ramlibacter sp.]
MTAARTTASSTRSAPLVALTAYYNPFKGEHRRHNYHVFRRNIGVPLVTVEWARDGHFDLAPGDADVMIRVEGGDLLWQKERLLNRGLAHIRREALARDVVLIDADAVFVEPDWAARVSERLDECAIVQAYSHVDYLPDLPHDIQTVAQLARVKPERALPSIGWAVAQGGALFNADPELVKAWAMTIIPVSGNPGMCTALRLASLPDFELYEGNIVGGGDLVLLASSLGALDELFAHRTYTSSHQADVRAWAQRCLPQHVGLGCADNRLMHLWHGTMEGRQYGQRLGILPKYDYDPQIDLDRSGEALRFSGKRGDALEAAVGAYLESRHDA